MVHHTRVLQFDARQGRIRFEFRGMTVNASHTIAAAEAQGQVVEGSICPLQLTLCSTRPLEYLAVQDEGCEFVSAAASGDVVRVRGRISDYLGHDLIRLDGAGGFLVKLIPPQQSTDYRRGSWLEAEGRLEASLPPDDHNEAGLRGSIVE